MPLTDLKIKSTKPKDRSFKLTDAGGLFVLVKPSGSKLWQMKYRYLGTEKLLSFGTYPSVSLREAREQRDIEKKLLSGGSDPSEIRRQKKLQALEASAQTFGLIASEYLTKQEDEGRTANTIKKNRWLLENLAAPLQHRPVAIITPMEVLAVIRRIERKGNLESAQRLRASISAVFRYAIVTGRAVHDPSMALKGALRSPTVRHRAAITDPAKVGSLLRAIDGFDGRRVIRDALRIMALCFPRPGELRHAEWPEIDLDNAIWSIPAARTKMRRPHAIPLSPQAVAILTDLKEITGAGRLVFPGVRTSTRALSENTLNSALRQLGFGKDEMTSHGFRTIASTLLNESGKWHQDAIERALAHLDGNAVRRAYARGEYWDERVRMAAWWADHLDLLKQAGTETHANYEEVPSLLDGNAIAGKYRPPRSAYSSFVAVSAL